MSRLLGHLTKQKRQKRKDVRAACAVKCNVSDACYVDMLMLDKVSLLYVSLGCGCNTRVPVVTFIYPAVFSGFCHLS